MRPRWSVADEPEEQQPEAWQEELLAKLEEEVGKLKVADVLVQTVFTVSSLGYRSLARLARYYQGCESAMRMGRELGCGANRSPAYRRA